MSNIKTVDIETQGLYPAGPNGHELISFAVGKYGMIQDSGHNEVDVLNGLSAYVNGLSKDTIFVSFMGGTSFTRVGFDFPFLGTRYLINDMEDKYPFKGYMHIDIFPVIQRQFILKFKDVGEITDMDAPGVSKMARDMNIKPESTKGANVKTIEELVPEEQIKLYLQEKGIMKEKTHDSLKDACLLLLKIPDDGMRGKDVPPLFAKWKETGDPEIPKKILKYNILDCEKTWKLYNKIKKIAPKNSMRVDIL